MTPDFQNGLALGLVCSSAVWLAFTAFWLVRFSRLITEMRRDMEELTAALGGALDECKRLRERWSRSASWFITESPLDRSLEELMRRRVASFRPVHPQTPEWSAVAPEDIDNL